nr:hypothetical protein [Streptococcus gallolyticus]
MAIEEKLNRRRLTIREALLALLKHKELRDITTTDIANQAESTRKSFYHSYQNVDEVIEEIEMTSLMILKLSLNCYSFQLI